MLPTPCSKIVHQLRATNDAKEKTKILADNAGPFIEFGDEFSGRRLPAETAVNLWSDFKISGLLIELCGLVENGIPFENSETSTFTSEVALVQFGLMYIRLIVACCMDLFSNDPEVMQLLCQRLAKVYNQLFTEVKLETCTDAFISVMVYYEPLLCFGGFCTAALTSQNSTFQRQFPSEKIYSFVLTLYFEPECRLMRIPPNYDPTTSKHYAAWEESHWSGVTRGLNFESLEIYIMMYCYRFTTILSTISFNKLAPNLVATAASLALSKYGHIAIIATLRDLFRREQYRNCLAVEASIEVMRHLLSGSDLNFGRLFALFQKENLHKDVVDACWDAVVRNPEIVSSRQANSLAKSGIELHSSLLKFIDDSVYTVENLNYFVDLILMGRCLTFQERRHLDDTSASYRAHAIPKHLTAVARLLHQFYTLLSSGPEGLAGMLSMSEALMHVAQLLRKAVRCQTNLSEETRCAIVQVWENMISIVIGMDTADFADWELNYYQKKGRVKQGCHWMKCPLFKHDNVVQRRMPLQCAVCRTVEYCSLRCQRGDWKGGHQAICRKPASTRAISSQP